VRKEEAEEAEKQKPSRPQPRRFEVSAPRRSTACLAFALLCLLAAFVPTAQADFGIKSMSVETKKADGTVELRAGAHPYEFTVDLEMNQDSKGIPEGTLRDLIVDLPAGLVGNPLAAPRCSGADFEGQFPQCPINTQIGVAQVKVVGIEETATVPVFNLTPRLGAPASVGFSIINENSFQEASLRPDDYGVRISDITIPTAQQIQSVTETIWGVPADERHDSERGDCLELGGKCSSDAPLRPFLTLPTSCTGPLKTTASVDSVQEPDIFQTETVESLGQGGVPAGLNSCDKPPFEPTIASQPETAAADSPTGLHFSLKIPQNELPEGIAAAHLKDTTVTLPAGLAVNPSAADGRTGCSLAQIGLGQEGPAQCPDASKVGTVTVNTPLLDHPALGSVYLAEQLNNPFNSLLAIYIVIDDPQTGVVVKLAGKVEPDPVTGQLRTTVNQNPQLPFEDFEFNFFGGPRASLTTPQLCGTFATTATLVPWSSPEGPTVTRSSSFQVTGSPAGPCASTEAQMPNAPAFEAGVSEPLAGAYSPFVLKLSRENGSQRLSALNTTLPAGVTANFSKVSECSEAQIASAIARSNPGQGALEKASPSCPASSQLGVVNVGAGSGSPLYVQGQAYLSGPYKGAPFSLTIITPAVAGPFDLGVVVVRAALYVNPETGQGTVKSDPLPTILQGIPLDVRSVAVKIDRSAYVLNPTSCAEKQVSGEAISTTGAVAPLSNRFQVGGCRALDYTPKLALSMKGAVRRSGHPAFKATLTQPSGQANSRRTVVILPPTTFIDQNHIANPCTRPQFAEGRCPPASVLGTVRVFTPLFNTPLEGKVYFRANGGERDLPDVVADLYGRVHVIAVGFVDAVTKKGSESSRVRTIFASLPDAPITKAIFSFKGGKQGVFVNSANLCKVPNLATVKMTAHNNKVQSSEQRIGTAGCRKK
jgi:hypothetical protein